MLARTTRKLFAGVLAALLIVTGCSGGSEPAGSQDADGSDVIKLAFEGPLTGNGAQDMLLCQNAVELAVEQFNAKHEADGLKVEVEYADDKADPKEAANLASKFVADEDIKAVIMGFNSSCSLAAAPIYNDAPLAQVNWFAISPALTEAGENIFRVIPTGALMVQYLEQWLKDDGHQKVAFFYENTDYGKGLYDVVAEQASEYGIEIVGAEAFLLDTKDFSAVINKFKAADPDAVVIFGQYEAASLWCQQARDLGMDKPLYGTDGIFAPAMIDLAGEAAEGTKTVAEFSTDSTNPVVQQFVQDFTEKTGGEPSACAGFAYDAVNVILKAIEDGARTREEISAGIASTAGFEGVTGTITIDENGDRQYESGAFIKCEVQDGKWAVIG